MIDIIYLLLILQIIDKLYSSSTQRRFKEYMANSLSLQKEIDKYYKTGWKNIKKKINKERRC